MAPPPKEPPRKTPKSPTSPQEDKFWNTPGDPSRTLRFSENLLDEEVNIGDTSTASFGSPITAPLELRKGKMFAEMESLDSFAEEPTVIRRLTPDDHCSDDNIFAPETSERKEEESSIPTPSEASRAASPDAPSLASVVSSKSPQISKPLEKPPADTPGTRQRRPKPNIELERIVVSLPLSIFPSLPLMVLLLVEDMVHHGRYYHSTVRDQLTIRRCYNVNHFNIFGGLFG